MFNTDAAVKHWLTRCPVVWKMHSFSSNWSHHRRRRAYACSFNEMMRCFSSLPTSKSCLPIALSNHPTCLPISLSFLSKSVRSTLASFSGVGRGCQGFVGEISAWKFCHKVVLASSIPSPKTHVVDGRARLLAWKSSQQSIILEARLLLSTHVVCLLFLWPPSFVWSLHCI